jgi:hypothetical protein
MVSTVFSFNLGIETMQLVVVAATIPWLLLLSRTKFYPPFRILGATFAAIAALGWIIERSFKLNLRVDSAVNVFAQHPLWLLGSLASVSLAATAWHWMPFRKPFRAAVSSETAPQNLPLTRTQSL